MWKGALAGFRSEWLRQCTLGSPAFGDQSPYVLTLVSGIHKANFTEGWKVPQGAEGGEVIVKHSPAPSLVKFKAPNWEGLSGSHLAHTKALVWIRKWHLLWADELHSLPPSGRPLLQGWHLQKGLVLGRAAVGPVSATVTWQPRWRAGSGALRGQLFPLPAPWHSSSPGHTCWSC